MTPKEEILAKVVERYLRTAERNQFNGLCAENLIETVAETDKLRGVLSELIEERRVDCVFSKYEINIYIKRMPDISVDRQLTCVSQEPLDTFCVYPTSNEVEMSCDVSKWDNRPFSKALLLVEPQLNYRSFDMAALERYTNDPRYQVHFEDYMGRMSIGDEAFREMGFPDRDKVSLQTFGLGFGEGRLPYLIVFLRYLANLSPEHQQFWNSYLAGNEVTMTRPYFEASIGGNFWQNRSVRNAVIQEIILINRMIQAIYSQRLFLPFDEKEIPIGVTGFLRPTAANFDAFVMALDKLLSDRINVKFFKGKVPLEEEIPREDGKVLVQRKGSIRLLEEWLLTALKWESEEGVREVVIGPLREVRRLRQKPAHDFKKDRFDLEFHSERRRLLGDVLNSLQNMRMAFSTHPMVNGIAVPEWLDKGEIDVL